MIYSTISPSDYQFNISVSTSTCNTKEDFSEASATLQYHKHSVSIDTLCKLIKEGRSLCHCYDDDDEIFDNTVKTQDNFRYTSFIPFDIDYSQTPMEDFIASLTYKPTIAYTTTRDGLEGMGYRYRLIYVFDGKIKGNENYEYVFDLVRDESGIGTLKDDCTHSTHQPIFGNALPNCRMECSHIIYGIPSTAARPRKKTKKKVPSQTRNKSEKKEGVLICDDTFIKDFQKLSLSEFVVKYCRQYQRIEESQLEYHNGYAEIDENYLSLHYRWDKDKKRIHIWKDGEGRRRRLSITAYLIRGMKSDITPEHLIYCLSYEVVHYYDNSDGVLNRAFILRVVESVMSKPTEAITIKGIDHRTFKVDKDYWESYGISAKAAVPIVRAMRNAKRIGELYDYALTDKENVKVMASHGVKTSISTLKRWRKAQGITKKNRGGYTKHKRDNSL